MKPVALALTFCLILLLASVPAVSAADYTTTNVMVPGFWEVFSQEIVEFKDVNNISFNQVENGRRISLIEFSIPSGATVSFTIYYGANSTVTGYAENHVIETFPFPRTQSTIVFGGETKEYDYLDIQPFYDYNLAGYAKRANATDEDPGTGFLVYSQGYGRFDNDLAVFYEVPDITVNTIYQVDMESDHPFTAAFTTNTAASVSKGASKSALDQAWDFINFAISIGSFVYEMALETFRWIKFFFWDNLTMTIALYLTMSMAFAARKSKGNMEKFYRQFFSDQRKLFEFILGTWNALITLISNFRAIFRI